MLAIPVLFAILSGFLYALCFPPFNFSYLAWIALIPLLLSTHESWRRNLWLGFVCGWIANLIIFSWLWATFKAAELSFLVTLGCWLSLSAILALYFGIFQVVYGFLPKAWWKPFLAAAVWVTLEEIRGWILTGFPWALFAHSQAYNLPLIQISSITGATGVSFILVSANSALSHCNKRGKTVVAGLMVVLMTWGWIRLGHTDSDEAYLKVAILQGNIDQYQKWDDEYETNIRVQYETLAAFAASIKPDLIIWPESAVPGWYPNEPRYAAWVGELVKKTKTRNLVGSVTRHNGKPYNSAFLFGIDGILLGRYDKRHLVPYGEYVPFGLFLAKWIPYLGELGLFEKGDNDTLLTFDSVPIAVNICYEAVFPYQVRRSMNKGAALMINITNDGWFLSTGAPEQHYVSNIFRAVENGRPVVRAANTGISAIIDSRGRELARSKLLVRTVLEGVVPLSSRPFTFYSKFGSWFSILCALSVFCWIFTLRKVKKHALYSH